MPTVWEHLRAVCHHWVALMTGSLPVAVYTVLILTFPDTTPAAVHHYWWNRLPPWIVWPLMLLGVVMAQYLAWRDMKRERDALLITRPVAPLGLEISRWNKQREGEIHYLLLGLRPGKGNFYPEIQFRLHFDAPLIKYRDQFNLPDSSLPAPPLPGFPYQEDGSAKDLTTRTVETMRWERPLPFPLLFSHETEFICELWSDQPITVTRIERIGY